MGKSPSGATAIRSRPVKCRVADSQAVGLVTAPHATRYDAQSDQHIWIGGPGRPSRANRIVTLPRDATVLRHECVMSAGLT